MKRKLTTLFLIMIMAISVTACGNNDKNNQKENITKVEETQLENSIEPSGEVETSKTEETTKVEETTKTEEPVKTKELITHNIDLSIFGEIVEELYVISNDTSKFVSKSDFFTYATNKGYTFYKYPETNVDENIITTEEAFEKTEISMKPDFFLENCEEAKYSYVLVNIDPDYDAVTNVQYIMKGCTEEYVNSQRDIINKAIDEGVFDGENIEIKYNKDKDTWTSLRIYFNGDTIDHPTAKYFAEISITLDTYKTYMLFHTY